MVALAAPTSATAMTTDSRDNWTLAVCVVVTTTTGLHQDKDQAFTDKDEGKDMFVLNLSPFFSVICCSDGVYQGQSCRRFNVFHPVEGHGRRQRLDLVDIQPFIKDLRLAT